MTLILNNSTHNAAYSKLALYRLLSIESVNPLASCFSLANYSSPRSLQSSIKLIVSTYFYEKSTEVGEGGGGGGGGEVGDGQKLLRRVHILTLTLL